MNSRALGVMTIVTSLVLLLPLPAAAQEPGAPLLKLFYPPGGRDSLSMAAPPHDRNVVRDRAVKRNIDSNLREVDRMLAQGKSGSAIQEHFNSLRRTNATGSIRGTIYVADGVTPLSTFSSVTAYNEFGMLGGYAYTSTGGDGSYVIEHLPTGDYYVKVSVYGLYSDTYFDGVADWKDATLVHVADGQQTDRINFILIQHTGAISGTIVGNGGTPLTECSVYAFNAEGTMEGRSGSTDSSGKFTVYGLRTGEYKIEASYWGTENYVSMWYDHALTMESATSIQVTEADTVKGKDFVLEHGGAIAGKIFPPLGGTLPPYSCSINALNVGEGVMYQAQSDSANDFVIPGLQTGFYKLEIRYNAGNEYINSWYDGANDMEHATSVSVAAPETTKAVLITLRRGGAIGGTVTCFAPEGLQVIAFDEQQRYILHTYTDLDGKYIIAGLPEGRYKLFVSGGSAVDQWYSHAQGFDDASSVNVHAPDTTRDINFSLDEGGYIRGLVTTPEGYPAVSTSSSFVRACRSNGSWVRSARVGADGRYTIVGLPTGQYKIYFQAGGAYASEWYDGKPSREIGKTLDIIAPGGIPNADITLEYSTMLRGFITDHEGNRLGSDDHTIDIYIYDAEQGTYVAGGSTSTFGGFQGQFLSRNYKACAFNVYWNSMQQQDSFAVTYYPHGGSFADSNAGILALQPQGVRTLTDFTMETASGAIAGTVYDRGTGQPVANGLYFITALDEQGFIAAASGYNVLGGSTNGSYLIKGLRPGKYFLFALSAAPSSNSYRYAQWYDGIDTILDSILYATRFVPPAGVGAVAVGAGVTSGVDFHFDITTSAPRIAAPGLPSESRLEQNYPNPFNPVTRIQYTVGGAEGRGTRDEGRGASVRLVVYDLLGREVAVLVNERKQPGSHQVSFDGSSLASGVYFYRLQAGNFADTKKLLLVR